MFEEAAKGHINHRRMKMQEYYHYLVIIISLLLGMLLVSKTKKNYDNGKETSIVGKVLALGMLVIALVFYLC